MALPPPFARSNFPPACFLGFLLCCLTRDFPHLMYNPGQLSAVTFSFLLLVASWVSWLGGTEAGKAVPSQTRPDLAGLPPQLPALLSEWEEAGPRHTRVAAWEAVL